MKVKTYLCAGRMIEGWDPSKRAWVSEEDHRAALEFADKARPGLSKEARETLIALIKIVFARDGYEHPNLAAVRAELERLP